MYAKDSTAAKSTLVVAAGGGVNCNELKIFNVESGLAVAAVRNLSAAIYSAAISTKRDGEETRVAIGGGGKSLMVFALKDLADDKA